MMNSFNNMMGSGFGEGWIYGSHIHSIFGYILLISAVLFAVWAIKNLKPKKLYNLAIVMLGIGLIGWLLTAPASSWSGSKWGGYGHMGGFGYGMMNNNMIECMTDEECHEEMETFMHQLMGIEENDQ